MTFVAACYNIVCHSFGIKFSLLLFAHLHNKNNTAIVHFNVPVSILMLKSRKENLTDMSFKRHVFTLLCALHTLEKIFYFIHAHRWKLVTVVLI